LRDFIAGQRVVDEDGEVDKLESPLFGDSLLRTLGQELAGEVGSAVDGLPAGAASTLAQVGVTVGDGGRLSIDEATLDDALLQDPDAARRVFEFRAETSDPGLSVYTHPDRLPSTDFEVRRTGADAWELDDGTRTIALEVDGTALEAPDGSAYEGLTMFWTGETPPGGPIDVTATQGIADRLHGTITRAIDATDGSLDRAIDDTKGQTARWRDDIAQIEARAEDYRLTLIDKFARLERALSLSESMLNQVRAQADAMTADG
jgi:flagellar hook-associated protein 2